MTNTTQYGCKMRWAEFWQDYAETLAVAAAFAFGGSFFSLWAVANTTVKRGLTVIVSGQIVCAATIALANGFLGWSIFVAPLLGLVCGLVAMPILFAVMKIGNRVEDRAADIADAGIKKATGKDAP